MEAELKSCSFVDNVCVYADSLQNYVIALVIPNPNAVALLAERLGRGTVKDPKLLYSDPDVTAHVLHEITMHSRKAGLHKSEIPQRIKLCPEDWTPDNGLLTAGLKIRRKPIKDYYMQDIEDMYRSSQAVVHDLNGNVRGVKSHERNG